MYAVLKKVVLIPLLKTDIRKNAPKSDCNTILSLKIAMIILKLENQVQQW